IRGRIKDKIFRDRGFCFIKRDDGQGDVFCHFAALERGGIPETSELAGRRVSFVLQRNRKDPTRTYADEIRPLDEPGPGIRDKVMGIEHMPWLQPRKAKA